MIPSATGTADLTHHWQKTEMTVIFSEQERNHYITMSEIGSIRKKIEREFIGLDPSDPKSTRIWVEKTRTSIISASNDIVRLAQEIITKAPADLETAKSIQMIR